MFDIFRVFADKNVQQNVQHGAGMGEHLTKRNGTWHFVRRVPEEFASYDKRGIVKLSTKVRIARDRHGQRASLIADRMNLDLEAYWQKCAAGEAGRAATDHAEAVRRARILDLSYRPAAAVALEPPAELRRRIETLAEGDRLHDPVTRAAVLGGVAEPHMKLSTLFAEFEAATATERMNYSPRQLKKWKAGKERAIEILIEVVTDKALQEMSRDDSLKYRDHWQARAVKREVAIGTANKNITHIQRMVRTVSQRHHLDKESLFAGLRLSGGERGQRKPFETAFIVDTILRPGGFDALNDQATAAVHILINTGARPCEVLNLLPTNIVLDANIPYIRVVPDGRVLKTESSERDIPLVGIALEAMRRFPKGFARYFDNEDSFSAAVNKHMKKHGMKPSPRHSVYSFRHSFKDRLRALECPDELTDELMGHSSGKPQYGDGHGLNLKLKYLLMTALAPAEASAPLKNAG
ncbi:molecular chaperone [Tardiphaga sp. 803_E3_N1_3]|uniref:molecular chaperone n=1 Tax=Tardiphaga sp. 803_E3_N1_3 TaxID=3240785 RepID=UPI003F204797